MTVVRTTRAKSLVLSLLAGIPLGLSQLVPQLSLLALPALLLLYRILNAKSFQRNNAIIDRWAMVACFLFTYVAVDNAWLFQFGFRNGASVILLNTLLLSLFLAVIWLKKPMSGQGWKAYLFKSVLPLAFAWAAFETLHQFWPFAYPLNSLGASLAEYPALVQWYAWFGPTAGTFWLVLTGGILFRLLSDRKANASSRPVIIALLGLLAPLVFSGLVYLMDVNAKQRKITVAAIHPNLNCYKERQDMSGREIATLCAGLVKEVATVATPQLILLPENLVPAAGWVSELEAGVVNESLQPLQEALRRFSVTPVLLTGAIIRSLVPTDREDDVLIYHDTHNQLDYFVHNSVLSLSPNAGRIARIKQELVPFEETIPMSAQLGSFFANWENDMAQVGYDFSTLPEPVATQQFAFGKVLSLVCYESLFPYRVATRLRVKDADLIAVHINEGWYDTVFGAVQMQRHARALAIATGKSVARSSNRGYTDLISPKGRILALEDTKEKATYLLGAVPLTTSDTAFTLMFSRLLTWGWPLGYLLSLFLPFIRKTRSTT